MTSMGTATRTELQNYDVSSFADDRIEELPAGTNLLVAGPSMMGKDDIVLRALAERDTDDQPAVVVTSNKNAAQLLKKLEAFDEPLRQQDCYVVDCSGTSGRGTFQETTSVKYVNSPNDLTGVGIAMVKCISDIGEDVRNGLGIGVLSLSTLLQYASENRVFNFAHVMTGRISTAGYLCLWTLDTSSHDDQTIQTIRSQFDYVAEVREDETGSREMRVLGGDPDWRTWEPL
jgi:hypothetical protein